LRKSQSLSLRGWHKRKLIRLENLVNRDKVACIGEKSRNRCNRCGSYRCRVNKVVEDWGRGIMYKRDRKGQRKGLRNSVSCINWLSLTLPSCVLGDCSNCSLCFLMGSKMFSTGFSNFRSFQNWYRSNKGSSNWNLRGNRKGNIGCSRSNRNVCTSNTETIDRVSNIVHSLENSISINILITASGYAKGILGLSLGRVNVLIAEAELAKLILCMELT